MTKVCEVELEGTIRCEGEDQGGCCCYRTECVILPCNSRPDALKALIDQWPDGYRFVDKCDFGADGWLIVYERPCDEDTATDG